MTSTLGMALLGLLAREPLTGYELSRSLKGAIRHFWQASHSQVYPELARLEAQGLVVHERIPQAGKPDQKRFGITEAGRRALSAWLVSPLEPVAKRSEAALRAYCVAHAEPREAGRFFREQALQHRTRLAEFEAFRTALEAEPGADIASEAFANTAVVMRGLAFEKAQAEWCEWMAERVEPVRKR